MDQALTASETFLDSREESAAQVIPEVAAGPVPFPFPGHGKLDSTLKPRDMLSRTMSLESLTRGSQNSRLI